MAKSRVTSFLARVLPLMPFFPARLLNKRMLTSAPTPTPTPCPQIEVYAGDPVELEKWDGWVRSRVRLLVSGHKLSTGLGRISH